MKKLLIIIIVFATVFSGCRYKEGPLISFSSVEKRLEGTWQIVGLTSDGIDSLQYYNDSCGSIMTLGFRYSDGSPMSNYMIAFDKGKKRLGGYFTFNNNRKNMNVYFPSLTISNNQAQDFVVIGPIGTGKRSEWRILKLTKNDFKISTKVSSKTYIISFKKE